MERYKDKQLSAYERAAALADTLSTEEQAQQLKYDAPAIEKAGLPSYNWWNEGLHGVARAGTATVFPQAIALAAAFDKDMMCRVGVQFGCFFVRANQHVKDQCQRRDCKDQTDHIHMTCERIAELVDHQRDDIGEAALITDGEPGPFCIVHFTLDGTDGCEARRAQQIEYQERVAADRREYGCQSRINVSGRAVEDAHRTNDVFLRDQTCDGRNRRFPGAEAERCENPADCAADGC